MKQYNCNETVILGYECQVEVKMFFLKIKYFVLFSGLFQSHLDLQSCFPALQQWTQIRTIQYVRWQFGVYSILSLSR